MENATVQNQALVCRAHGQPPHWTAYMLKEPLVFLKRWNADRAGLESRFYGSYPGDFGVNIDLSNSYKTYSKSSIK